jgi:hypothetical protein
MDEDDRDFPPSAWEARIEAAYRRMKRGLRPDPWLPRVTNLTGLRRQVRRARAGVIGSASPQLSARAWADTLEQGIVLSELEIREERRQIEEQAERAAEEQRRVLEYNRCWMEVYRALKRTPEAADPNSEIGAQVLAMKRELRQLRGRPRRRRKRRDERAGR